MRVLVADDSLAVRERLVFMMTEIDGVDDVDAATDAHEAILCIDEKMPDLLILDLRMPKGGGFEVLRHTRSKGRSRPVTIVLTNYPRQSYREKCFSFGAHYFLDKSNEFEEAVNIVKGLVRSIRKGASQ